MRSGSRWFLRQARVAIMQGAPDEHAGSASGLLQKNQQIGGALGISVITSNYSFALTTAQDYPQFSVAAL